MNMANNKKERFTKSIESNKGIIYKVANSYCYSRDHVDDLIQEILIQVWLSFDRYDESYKFSTWLYRVALNTAISYYRREKKHETLMLYTNTQIIEAAEEEYEGLEEKLKLVHQLIGNFKEIDRALVLLYLDGYSQKEAADIIGLSETNVATKLHRIRKKLKEQIKELKKNGRA